MILTGLKGTNAELIYQVAQLYLKKGAIIADVTYGRGNFWKGITKEVPEDGGPALDFYAFDIDPQFSYVEKADFRSLPFENDFLDVVVLDPPYMHGGATVKGSISKCYGNKETKYASHKAIIELYWDGIKEACRVLKPGGLLWVKCQDEIESGKQHWSHVEILELATQRLHGKWHRQGAMFRAKDLFVLVQSTIPARRQEKQHHARKNHSYLWIFKKAE